MQRKSYIIIFSLHTSTPITNQLTKPGGDGKTSFLEFGIGMFSSKRMSVDKKTLKLMCIEYSIEKNNQFF